MIAAQGGDPDAPLPRSRTRETVTAAESGWLRRLDARAVGVAAWRLGAGRARKEDPVSAAAGVICLAKPGDRVERRAAPAGAARRRRGPVRPGPASALDGAIEIGDQPPAASPRSSRADRPEPSRPRRLGRAESPVAAWRPAVCDNGCHDADPGRDPPRAQGPAARPPRRRAAPARRSSSWPPRPATTGCPPTDVGRAGRWMARSPSAARSSCTWRRSSTRSASCRPGRP